MWQVSHTVGFIAGNEEAEIFGVSRNYSHAPPHFFTKLTHPE